MINRFLDDTGEELLRRASHLRVDLFRDDEGVQVAFRLTGSIGQPDENILGGVGVAAQSDLAFLTSLIKRFEGNA